MIKSLLRRTIKSNQALTKKLLGLFINLHNYSYKKITQYSSDLNGGVNPKHEITRYHDYFVAGVEPNDTVLDVGSGGGLLAYDVAKKAKRVSGIDISSNNIAHARKHYQRDNLEFVIGDATTYPFTVRFDKLILSNVLEHIEDRVGLLRRLGELSGTLLFRVPMITREWLAVYKRDHGYPYLLDDTHHTEYTLEQVKKETAEAGWRIESYQVNWGEFWAVLKKD